MHTGGSCQRWHSSGPLPKHSKTRQCHFGFAHVPASGGASEAERCWQLPEVSETAAAPLAVGRGAQAARAPRGQKES